MIYINEGCKKFICSNWIQILQDDVYFSKVLNYLQLNYKKY